MYFPLLTLLERLQLIPWIADIPNTDIQIQGIHLLTEKTVLIKSGFLYIGDIFPENCILEEGAFVLIPEASVQSYNSNYILYTGNQHLIEIFNDALELFECFMNWEMKIEQIIYNQEGLQELISLYSEIMGNPAYVVDSSLKVLAIDKTPVYMELSAIWKHLRIYHYLPYNIVVELQKKHELDQMRSYNQAVLFDSGVFNNPFIVYNLYNSNNLCGHFFVVGYNKKITSGDIAYANHLGEKLYTALDKDQHFMFVRGGNYEHFFEHLLTGAETNKDHIQTQMNRLGLDTNGRYCVAKFLPPNTDRFYMEYLCGKLELMNSAKPLLYENAIVAIFPLREEENIHKLENKLMKFSIENNTIGGISDGFDGISRLHKYYPQTSIAITYGAVFDEGVFFCYRDYVIFHLLYTCGNYISLSMICSKELFYIQKYDSQHNTDYFNTLKVFLENERNIALTAEDLKIHRNTLIYRINRLEELYHLDLEQAKSRNRLMLSYHIIELQKSMPHNIFSKEDSP